MRNNLNKIKQLLLLLTAAFVVSCSEDLYETETDNHTKESKFKTARGSFKQFNLSETIKKLKIYNSNSSSNRNDNGFFFTIDTTNILKMYSENTESYTIKVSNDDTPNGSFQNLVIKKTAFSPTKAYLFTYYPTEAYKQQILNNVNTPFVGNATIVNLNPDHLVLTPLSCYEGTIQLCNTGGGGTHIAYCNDCTPYTLTGTICDDAILDSPGGDNGSGLISGGTNGGSGSYNDGGGSSYFNIPTRVEPPYMDLTEFMSTEDNYKFNTIMQNITLNAKGYAWFGTDVEKIRNVYSYLFTNNFSTQSKSFGKNFINQSFIQDGLELDLNKSFKSPFFIDMNSVNGNTPEEVKFREVYNSLMQSPKFKSLFHDLFNNTPLFNVKFTIENITQQFGPGSISGACDKKYINSNPVPYNNIIIDRNFILNNSNLAIAQTIIHECIHAYLNVKLYSPNIGISINNINDLDFQECISYYYNNFSGLQTQHSFFVDSLIPTLTEIFIDTKNLLLTPEKINSVENPTNGAAFLYQPLNNPPDYQKSSIQVQWNWNTFFTYLSYTGLQNCNAFPFSYPQISTLDDYYFFHYINIYNLILKPN